MRCFTIISKKGTTILQEVEVEVVRAIEDPSVMWLPKGESKMKILKPESLFEKQLDGSLTPPVWHSHAFYTTEFIAREIAKENIRAEMERAARKKKLDIDEDAYMKACAEIQAYHL